MIIDDKSIRIDGAIVVWDGVTRPAVKDGKTKWTLKIVIEPNNPHLADFIALGGRAIQQSQWSGNLPANAHKPMNKASPNEFNGLFPGWAVINGITYKDVPEVVNEQNQLIDPMTYRSLFFAGQQVDVAFGTYEYNVNGNMGIAASLGPIRIIQSANKQKIDVGGGPGGPSASDAFGAPAGNQAVQQQQQPAQQQPAQTTMQADNWF